MMIMQILKWMMRTMVELEVGAPILKMTMFAKMTMMIPVGK